MELNAGIAAIVTGGASGLGEATVRRLASSRAKVAIFDMDSDRGEAIAAEIGGVFCKVDITSEDELVAAFAKARATHGQERVLVNCAGIGGGAKTASRDRKTGEIHEYPMDRFEKIIGVNLVGTFRCITKSAAGMLTLDPLPCGDRGAIVNTASVAAKEGQIGQVAYAASKAGIVGLTLPVARDLASECIRVNTILPGLFDTPLLARVPEEVRASLAKQVPCPSRLGLVEEFAHIVETMITCGYLNGEHMRLDGAIRMAPR